jgi:hypothetical protein
VNFKVEKKKIGRHTYYVTQLNALVGRKALVRLAKFLGPALAAATKGDVTDALARVAESLSEDDFEYFCDLFAEKTVVTGGEYDGEPDLHLIFDEHFAGEYLEMVQWLAFAFQVNFASFFSGAAAQMAKAKAAAGNTSSDSATERTGTSGGS